MEEYPAIACDVSQITLFTQELCDDTILVNGYNGAGDEDFIDPVLGVIPFAFGGTAELILDSFWDTASSETGIIDHCGQLEYQIVYFN